MTRFRTSWIKSSKLKCIKNFIGSLFLQDCFLYLSLPFLLSLFEKQSHGQFPKMSTLFPMMVRVWAVVLHDQTKESPNSIENRKFCIHHNVLVVINSHILGYMFIVYIQIPIPRHNHVYPHTLYIILNFPLFAMVMNSTMSSATFRTALHL